MLLDRRDFVTQAVHNEVDGECAVLHAAGGARVVSDEALQHLALLLDAPQRMRVVVLHLGEVRVDGRCLGASDRRGPNCH